MLRRKRESIIREALARVPVTAGGASAPASQLDANGTTLDVNVIVDGEVLKRVGTTIVSVPVGAPGAHAATHQPGGADPMAVDAAAATGSLRTVGAGALQACAGNDARLTDARTPTAHVIATNVALGAQHTISGTAAGQVLRASGAAAANFQALAEGDITNLTADLAAKEATANKAVASGYASLDGTTKVPIAQIPTGATGTTVPFGNDARLSDARTPLAHVHPTTDVTSGRFIAARMLDGLLGLFLQGRGAGVDPAYTSLVTTRLTADNAAIAAAVPTTALQVANLTQAALINDEWDIEWILDIANSIAADVFVFNVTSTAGTLTGRYTVEGTTGVPGAGAGVVKLLQQPAGTITTATANAPGATGTIGLVLTVVIRARVKLTVANGTIQLLLRAGTNAAASSGTATVKAQSQMRATKIV